ncbi:MAG: hypothetical protein LBJ00_06015 [Planctomycetaceae bacterium]|jgi:hypothetical protein|nr:hypothetical protein [Planctomycetaceae bacterium]
MSTEHIFVEEYRKELASTGYPFTKPEPLLTSTGYALPLGTIADASIYCERSDIQPVISSIVKENNIIAIKLNLDCEAVIDLRTSDEVIEFYNPLGVFYGIFVLDTIKARGLSSWKNGEHLPTKAYYFCPRCLAVIPPLGIQRFRTDTNKIISGNMAFAGLQGTILRLLNTKQQRKYIEVNFTGDPAYTITNGSCASENGVLVCQRKGHSGCQK